MDTSAGMRWLGVAGIELSVGGRTLLIDPFVSRPPAPISARETGPGARYTVGAAQKRLSKSERGRWHTLLP
ncbi:MAG TPA: hypothetical protein VE258_05290 [Ktedonobacterales bacterium]|nr:hypothetical protein [Ktedonobacterales bacterium]